MNNNTMPKKNIVDDIATFDDDHIHHSTGY